MKLLSIKPSSNPDKKYDALFDIDGKTKTVSFGAKGYSDYTQNKSKVRRMLYLIRHRKNEDWTKPDTAGALSRYILWGQSTSLHENIANFKRRFNL